MAAVSSIPANLSEMCAYTSPGQQKQKVSTCIGEANEVEMWLNLCKDTELIDRGKCIDFIERIQMIRKMLYKFMKSFN